MQMYKKMLGKQAGRMLDKLMGPLEVALRTASMMVAEGLEGKVRHQEPVIVEYIQERSSQWKGTTSTLTCWYVILFPHVHTPD